MKVYGNVPHFVQNAAEPNFNNANTELQLKTGDVIQAEVLEVNISESGENCVLLGLNNGAKIKAAVEEGVTITKGELLNFVVKDASEGNIILKILSSLDNSPTVSFFKTDETIANISKLLSTLGFAVDKNILDVASESQQQGFVPSKTSLTNAIAMLSQAPDLTVENVAFLCGNGIFLKDSGIDFSDAVLQKTINEFLNRQTDFCNKVNNISDMITNVINEMKHFSSDFSINNFVFISHNEDIALTDNQVQDMNAKSSIHSAQKRNTTDKTYIFDKDKAYIPSMPDRPETVIQQLEDIKQRLDNNFVDIKKITKFIADQDNLYFEASDREQLSLQNDNRNSNISHHVKHISEEFGGQIAKNISNIKNNLDELVNILSIVNTSASQQLHQNISEVQRTINLMFEFNKYINFYEIPLKVGDFKANTQLYILNNRRKAKSFYKNDGYTAYLSLDTLNLGRFDSIISIKNKTVNINISLQDKKQADFIKRNINSLIESIENLGFKTGDIRVKFSSNRKTLPQIHKELINTYICPKSMLDVRI